MEEMKGRMREREEKKGDLLLSLSKDSQHSKVFAY